MELWLKGDNEKYRIKEYHYKIGLKTNVVEPRDEIDH